MGQAWEAYVQIKGLTTLGGNGFKIEESAKACWPGWRKWDVHEVKNLKIPEGTEGHLTLTAESTGMGSLFAKTPDETTDEVRQAVWAVTGRYVEIEIAWWYRDKEPDEHSVSSEDDYDKVMEKISAK